MSCPGGRPPSFVFPVNVPSRCGRSRKCSSSQQQQILLTPRDVLPDTGTVDVRLLRYARPRRRSGPSPRTPSPSPSCLRAHCFVPAHTTSKRACRHAGRTRTSTTLPLCAKTKPPANARRPPPRPSLLGKGRKTARAVRSVSLTSLIDPRPRRRTRTDTYAVWPPGNSPRYNMHRAPPGFYSHATSCPYRPLPNAGFMSYACERQPYRRLGPRYHAVPWWRPS